MKILVLGAYGLIGSAIVHALNARGDHVVGLGRSVARGRAMFPADTYPNVSFIGADIAQLSKAVDWLPHLGSIDVVINASGALQSGLRDNLVAVQREAISALIEACEQAKVSKFVQISAPAAGPNADTEFLRTKGEADEVLMGSSLDWTVFKPGLVISPAAYGGTSLIRMVAAFPIVQPMILAKSKVQTVAVDDLAHAVVRATIDPQLSRQVFDLVEDKVQTVEAVILSFRAWLGFSVPRQIWRINLGVGFVIGWVADVAGWLGWRAPLRTTAVKVMAADVLGDPEPWRKTGGAPLKTLTETLAAIPATPQERTYARVRLAFPFLVVILAAFWLASGLIGYWQAEVAAGWISAQVGSALAQILIYGGIAIDLAVGIGLLWRKSFVAACWASILVALAYLLMGTLITPELWADPLGPLVKIFPAIGLALALASLGNER